MLQIVEYAFVTYLGVTLFLLGSVVGSFLNVVIARLPRRKSLVSPGSHCFGCGRKIPLRENIPLLSYWFLGGKCKKCSAPFSIRYFFVELLTALGFVAIFFFEVGWNIHHIVPFGGSGAEHLRWGNYRTEVWWLVGFHILFFCFLICAVGSNLEFRKVPRVLWLPGLVLGLAGAAYLAWPKPYRADQALSEQPTVGISFAPDEALPGTPRAAMPTTRPWYSANLSPHTGYYLWPVWEPLPTQCAPGSWQLGLLTGLAGMTLGALLVMLAPLRTTWGDVTILALTGTYLGWQPTLVAFVVALMLALIAVLILGTPTRLSILGVCLPIGILAAWFGWPWISGHLTRILFFPWTLALLGVGCVLFGGLRLAVGRPFFYEAIEPTPAREPGAVTPSSDETELAIEEDLTDRQSTTIVDFLEDDRKWMDDPTVSD